MTTLSIIVPVYNKEKYIDDCLQSILAQTYIDFELILVNDGSTDASYKKCREYAEKDNRIKVINQTNAGVSTARNNGIQISTGTYIGFVDSDDTISLDMYEILMRNAIENMADISICAMEVTFPYKTIVSTRSSSRMVYEHTEGLYEFLKGKFNYSANNKIVRSSIIKKLRFEGSIYEDILLMCKAFLAANSVVFEDVVGYHYIVRENSTSMSGFGPRYFETIAVSSKMVDLVSHENNASVIASAKAFDVMANVSLLNLLLMDGKEKYLEQYNKVSVHLLSYQDFIKQDPHVARKHKYAFLLHNASPKLYALIMYVYCLVTKSEVISRTRKK
jgi:glycosyltransferase involved in cell wall biosynthesis